MAEAENRLIESLPKKDRLPLLSVCKRVELKLADVLADPDTPMRHAYVPTEGFISLVTRVEGSSGVKVGMIGCEGMLGALRARCLAVPAACTGPGAGARVTPQRRRLAA